MTDLEHQFCMGLWNDDIQLVRRLLEQHPDLPSILHNPVHQSTYMERAAATDSLEIMQFIVQHGADIHAPRGGTDVGIVYDAVRRNALRVTRWLLEQGAELHDMPSKTRRCVPLVSAVGSGNLEMVRLLVEHGRADVNATWGGGNALSLAMQNGSEEMVDYLRSRGARTPRELGLLPPPPETLLAYLTEAVGPPSPDSIREIIPSQMPIAIHVIPNDDEGHLILVTDGMSARPMGSPEGVDLPLYGEVAIRLAPDWPLDAESFQDPQNFWPIEWLRRVALYPNLGEHFTRGAYAIISNDDPPRELGPGAGFSCLLVLKSDHRFGVWERPDGAEVHFYELIPLYAEERDLELEKGLAHLFEEFETYMVGQVVEVGRINVATV